MARTCPTCGLPTLPGDFRVEYLCLLDQGCRGNSHSGRCEELNGRRAVALRTVERRRRADLMQRDLEAGGVNP